MIVYIAGPMTGRVGLNRTAFWEAERILASHGHVVLSPARTPVGLPTIAYADIDAAMIRHCDVLALLPGWDEGSLGVAHEVALARMLGVHFLVSPAEPCATSPHPVECRGMPGPSATDDVVQSLAQ